MRDHHGLQGPLIERAATLLRVGRWSYWLFLWGVLFTALFVFEGFVMGTLEETNTWREVALNAADTIFSSKWIGLGLKTLWHHPWLIGWLVVTLWLALGVDSRLDSKYSQFWHDDNMRLKLRKEIGLG